MCEPLVAPLFEEIMSNQATRSIKPVLFVVTSNHVKGDTGISTGFWLAELTHPLSKLEFAGISYELASVEGGQPPIDGFDLNDEINAHYWNDPHFRYAIHNTRRLADVDLLKYSAIFFAGGHGTMWDFPNDPDISRTTRQFYESGGIVAAVCHGPAALVNVTLSDGSYLVDGKRVAAFTNAEERDVFSTDIVPFLLESELIKHGAKHQAAANWAANVVTDGRLVTGQNPASAGGVGEAIRDLLINPV
jgi:putative intracellular protease/amidase